MNLQINYEMMALATIALTLGMIGSFSITQGIKSWRKERLEKPLLDSSIKLMGRVFGFVCTVIGWVAVDVVLLGGDGGQYNKPLLLGLVAFMTTPWAWEKHMMLLKMIKPEWAARLSGQ